MPRVDPGTHGRVSEPGTHGSETRGNGRQTGPGGRTGTVRTETDGPRTAVSGTGGSGGTEVTGTVRGEGRGISSLDWWLYRVGPGFFVCLVVVSCCTEVHRVRRVGGSNLV